MASVYFPAFFSQSTVFLAPLIIAIVAVIAVKVAVSTNWYKRIFAKIETKCQSLSKDVFAPLKRKIFADLSERLKEVNGDVLEIGIGAGENFLYYPQGTSLIAVDPNPHVETLLRENLEKIGDRVHLKKFVVASAEDMNCTSGEFGVKDNSVAAVVGTFLLCSLTDDQTTKTLQEVKRVLLPGGRFYFLEHVAGKPDTFQSFVQHFMTKSLIYPTLINGCRCNKNTLSWIENAGFKMVQSEKLILNFTPEMLSGNPNIFSLWFMRIGSYIENPFLFGFAEKGQCLTG